jgi:hypothetical protein
MNFRVFWGKTYLLAGIGPTSRTREEPFVSAMHQVLKAASGRAFQLLALGSDSGLMFGLLATRVLALIVYEATPSRSPNSARGGYRRVVDWACGCIDRKREAILRVGVLVFQASSRRVGKSCNPAVRLLFSNGSFRCGPLFRAICSCALNCLHWRCACSQI